jgi:DNA repair exonuclease SbcCD ATPase subunit
LRSLYTNSINFSQCDRLEQTLERQENELSNYREQLKYTQGVLFQKQGTLTETKQEIATLSANKTELERRVALIDKQHPDLAYLEQLQKQIEQIKLETSGLEGQKEVLRSQIDNLKIKQDKLREIELRFSTKQIDLKQLQSTYDTLSDERKNLETYISQLRPKNEQLELQEQQILQVIKQNQIKQTELEQDIVRSEESKIEIKEELQSLVNTLETKKGELQKIEAQLLPKHTELKEISSQIEQLKIQTKDLEKQATELELLRVTYDALSLEKNSFETRIDRLRPEIAGLETQKQQILQAIRENEAEYRQVEQKRAELRRINSEISGKYAELQDLKQKVARIQGILASLAEDEAKLKTEITRLEKYLKQLKGEIEEIENSAAFALQALRKPLWNSLPQTLRQIDATASGEQQFILEFTKHLTQQGLTFHQRVINAFHTSLKVQDISALVILAGISGTGKSELPQRYADYIGARKLTLAVQPRWDSPQDLQGFYNYIEKKYKPTDLMRGLYQYQNDPNMSDRLVIVLLDEMNLARVEYYFSDFLSKLETRRSGDTYLELDVGSLPLKEEERKLAIPKQFLFVGTMNEDETTQSLSDKVLDRANVLTFGKPQQLKLREEASSNEYVAKPPEDYISYSQFEGWMRKPDPNSEIVTKLRGYLDRANAIMDKLGHPFAHRVYQAITRYVVNYPGVVEGNKEAFNAALADQFGQKLLPKLRGLMLDECGNQLDEFSRLIEEIGDRALIEAFTTARNGHFGQFQWRGFVYLEEESDRALSLVGG